MTHDEEHTQHSEHIVEVAPRTPSTRAASRRSLASISVALCLAIAGLAIAVGIVREQRSAADERTRDAMQREDLKDGWSTLGALAAQHTPSVTAPAAPQPTERNVVIVNLPPPVATSPAAAAPLSAPASQPIQPLPVTAPSAPNNFPAPYSAPAPNDVAPAPSSTPASDRPAPNLSPITYPASQSCGLSTCNVDSVCCNASCGVCTAPGETCSQRACG